LKTQLSLWIFHCFNIFHISDVHQPPFSIAFTSLHGEQHFDPPVDVRMGTSSDRFALTKAPSTCSLALNFPPTSQKKKSNGSNSDCVLLLDSDGEDNTAFPSVLRDHRDRPAHSAFFNSGKASSSGTTLNHPKVSQAVEGPGPPASAPTLAPFPCQSPAINPPSTLNSSLSTSLTSSRETIPPDECISATISNGPSVPESNPSSRPESADHSVTISSAVVLSDSDSDDIQVVRIQPAPSEIQIVNMREPPQAGSQGYRPPSTSNSFGVHQGAFPCHSAK
jgi:hypothetical protein